MRHFNNIYPYRYFITKCKCYKIFVYSTLSRHFQKFQVALMVSWPSVAKEVATALGPVEAARVTAAMLDAPAANAPPALAKARLAAAQELLRGPLGQDPGTSQFNLVFPKREYLRIFTLV